MVWAHKFFNSLRIILVYTAAIIVEHANKLDLNHEILHIAVKSFMV